MHFLHIPAILALLVFGCLPAGAEVSSPKDASIIQGCLATLDKGAVGQEVYESRCLLKVANRCIGAVPASASDGKQIECLDRERMVWDRIINDSYQTVMNALEPEQARKLREMQRAWIHVRDLTCGFWYDYFQGTMANLMISSCQNRETARRAIYLRVFAIDIVQRK
jgi:uncharacterized protein YecT (DUF1311 family)